MSLKLKVLGLGLFAMLAMGAMASIQASAETSGHFYNDNAPNLTLITGTEGGEHRVKFRSDGGTPIECDSAEYHAKTELTTTQVLTFAPTWSECHTEGGAAGSITVDVNGCELKFTSNSKASTHNPTTDATAGVKCPVGVAGVLVTHPNCTMRMPPQTINHAVTYTTIELNKKHAITLNSTASGITAHYEAGICIFLGTTHTATMNGSATVHARDAISGAAVGITAT